MKKRKKNKLKDVQYFENIYKDKNAITAKLFDRSQNIMTYIGAFENDKLFSEIAKTVRLVGRPKINRLCKMYPEQKKLFATMHHVMEEQRDITRIHLLDDFGDEVEDDEELRNKKAGRIFINLPNGLHPFIVPAERVRVLNPDIYGKRINNTAIKCADDYNHGQNKVCNLD